MSSRPVSNRSVNSRAPFVCAIALLHLGLGAGAEADLTGFWQPDMSAYERSKELKAPDPNAPPAPPASPGPAETLPALRITHNEPSIVFEFVGADGGTVSTLRMTTDHRENTNARGGGALVQTSRSRWDGGSLRTEWRMTRDGTAFMTGTDEWTLSAGGNTLTLVSQLEDSKSRSRTKTVYRRKSQPIDSHAGVL